MSAEMMSVREQYAALWQAILDRHNKHQRLSGEPETTQRQMASELEVTDAAISRTLTGKGMPRSLDLAGRMADALGATPEETRTLLAFGTAIVADDAGESRVASHFAQFHRPLFAEAMLMDAKVIRARSVVESVLISAGLGRKPASAIADSLADKLDSQQALGRLLLSAPPELRDALQGIPVRKLVSLFRTFSQIAVIDFDSAAAQRPAILSLARAEREGKCRVRAWQIPNLSIVRLDIEPRATISDQRHDGIEFVYVASGSGKFAMTGIEDILMTPKGFDFIAYRPMQPHRFTAGSKGARVFVVSYNRPEDHSDPVLDLIARARADA